MPPRRKIKLPRCWFRSGKLKDKCRKAHYLSGGYMDCMQLVKQGKCPLGKKARE